VSAFRCMARRASSESVSLLILQHGVEISLHRLPNIHCESCPSSRVEVIRITTTSDMFNRFKFIKESIQITQS
jgi:hypothetical protein